MLATTFKNIRMHENQTFSFFDFELSDIVNYSLNLGETIPDSKIVRKILRSLPKKFRTKAIVIEGSRDINSMRVDELVGSIQTYEITLPSSQKPKDSTFKVFENEDNDICRLSILSS